MPAQIKYFMLYCILVLNGIILGVVFFNPEMKNWWTSGKYYNFKPPIFKPWYFKDGKRLNDSKKLTSIYRGNPQRTGYYDQIVDYKNKKNKFISKNFINVGIHGASKSSPTVTDKYAITTSDFGLLSIYKKADEEYVDPIWTFMAYSSGKGMHSTPLYYDKQLIFGDYNGVMYSLDIETKEFNWMIKLGDTVGASPNIDKKGDIYISIETYNLDGYIVKINPINGEVIWMSDYIGEQGHSSPVLSEDESVLVFGDNSNHVTAISTSTGKRIWKTNVGGPVKSTPNIVGEYVYFTSWDSHLYALKLSNGYVHWKTRVKGLRIQSSSSVSVKDKAIVLHSEKGICRYDLITGKEQHCYQTELLRAARKSSSIMTTSETGKTIIWAACEFDYLCAIDLEKMILLSKWNVKDGISGEPVLYKNEIYVVTDGDGGLVKL